jgi:hypothetical protein
MPLVLILLPLSAIAVKRSVNLLQYVRLTSGTHGHSRIQKNRQNKGGREATCNHGGPEIETATGINGTCIAQVCSRRRTGHQLVGGDGDENAVDGTGWLAVCRRCANSRPLPPRRSSSSPSRQRWSHKAVAPFTESRRTTRR